MDRAHRISAPRRRAARDDEGSTWLPAVCVPLGHDVLLDVLGLALGRAEAGHEGAAAPADEPHPPWLTSLLPDVSVVIPTRSRWSLLSTAALPSALEQQDIDHEVIVVDDGSSDETADRLGEVADPRLRVLRNEAPGGVAAARNRGVFEARGRWISFLDDDDLWSPRKLRAQLDAAESANAVFVYAAGGGLDSARRFLYAVAPPEPATITRQLLRWNVIWCGCSNVMAKTDVTRELGGFDERLFQLADWDIWIRLALAGRAAAVQEILVGYVMHAKNMLLTEQRDIFRSSTTSCRSTAPRARSTA